jgi:sporulation protein YlmC with PRC-barrel domain
MELVRDVLDKLMLDRNGRDMGRVDGVVLETRPDAPPRLSALELGPAVLAHRVHPVLGRWVAALESGLGISEGRPVRIPADDVLSFGDHIKVDRAVGETAAATFEHRLRRWIGSIPGSS